MRDYPPAISGNRKKQMSPGDNTALIGFAGAWLSLSLSQWSDLFGLGAGALTCCFVVWRMVRYYKNKEQV